MLEITQFIPESLFIVCAVLYGLGECIKGLKTIDNKWIPFILMPLGIIFSCLLLGPNILSALQGICCALMSVGINQVFRKGIQLKNK